MTTSGCRDGMMKKFLTKVAAMVALVLALAGCAASSRLTAANLTQPVMVGPVGRIGGDRSMTGAAKKPFGIWVVNGKTSLFIIAPGEADGGKLAEATDSPEKVDGELLRRVDSADDKIMVEEIGFRSYTYEMFFIVVNATHYRSGVGMIGAVYAK